MIFSFGIVIPPYANTAAKQYFAGFKYIFQPAEPFSEQYCRQYMKVSRKSFSELARTMPYAVIVLTCGGSLSPEALAVKAGNRHSSTYVVKSDFRLAVLFLKQHFL